MWMNASAYNAYSPWSYIHTLYTYVVAYTYIRTRPFDIFQRETVSRKEKRKELKRFDFI